VGHGVAVVLNIQAKALIKRGFEVIIAGPRSANDFTYTGCTRYELEDPASAAALAAELSVNLIIAHTMPFFDISRWVGSYQPVICYDYGEPPSDLSLMQTYVRSNFTIKIYSSQERRRFIQYLKQLLLKAEPQ
jgi:hypothetical protein